MSSPTHRDLSIEGLKVIVAPIAKEYGIGKVYLFGSRAREDHDENSDFDFFIHTGDIRDLFQISRLMRDLQISLNNGVDIITSGALKDDDVFVTEIERDGILIYER